MNIKNIVLGALVGGLGGIFIKFWSNSFLIYLLTHPKNRNLLKLSDFKDIFIAAAIGFILGGVITMSTPKIIKTLDNTPNLKRNLAIAFLCLIPISSIVEIIGIGILLSFGLKDNQFANIGITLFSYGRQFGILSILPAILGISLCFTAWSSIRNRLINWLIILNPVSFLILIVLSFLLFALAFGGR